jgi:hypothetical protein
VFPSKDIKRVGISKYLAITCHGSPVWIFLLDNYPQRCHQLHGTPENPKMSSMIFPSLEGKAPRISHAEPIPTTPKRSFPRKDVT